VAATSGDRAKHGYRVGGSSKVEVAAAQDSSKILLVVDPVSQSGCLQDAHGSDGS
jgi:hypothetical protein